MSVATYTPTVRSRRFFLDVFCKMKKFRVDFVLDVFFMINKFRVDLDKDGTPYLYIYTPWCSRHDIGRVHEDGGVQD